MQGRCMARVAIWLRTVSRLLSKRWADVSYQKCHLRWGTKADEYAKDEPHGCSEIIHDPICRWGSVFWFLFFEIKMMILNTCMEHKRNFNTNRRETNSHAQSSFGMKLSKSYVSSPWLSVLSIWWFQETLRILWRCLCTAPMSCCWAKKSPFGIRDAPGCSESMQL